jgi:hypothetical protein
MSGFGGDVELREVKATAENGDMVPMGGGMPGEERDEQQEVALWKSWIKRRQNAEDFTEWKKCVDEAKKFYKGDTSDDPETNNWQGPTVKVNLWRRIQTYFVDAIFSAYPNLSVRPAQGRENPETLGAASAVEAMVMYSYRETKMRAELKRVLTRAWSDGISQAKVDLDPNRGIFRLRWTPGLFLVDGQAHGDLSRGMWTAEEVKVSRMAVLRDKMFPLAKRKALAGAFAAKTGGEGAQGYDSETTLWYVYSRAGTNPMAALETLTGGDDDAEQVEPDDLGKVCFVICDEYDGFLYEAGDPCPWLDEDEYPYPVLKIDDVPGEWYPSPVWKMLSSLISAINWLLSFHIASMKRTASSFVLYNKTIVKNMPDIANAAHMSAHGVEGPPAQAASILDLGRSDMSMLQGAEMIQGWLDQLSGYNEVARGESSGRKTAEEARYLQSNTSLVVKGPSQSFDDFMEESFRQIGLASVYYIPAFSWSIGPGGEIMTQAMQEVPPQPQGMDPMTGQPIMSPPSQTLVPVPVTPEEAAQVGAVDMEQYGYRLPDTQVLEADPTVDPLTGMLVQPPPQFQHPQAGKVVRKGVDYFLGVETAAKWPKQKFEDIKRDLLFSFEAGSTRASFRQDQQTAATNALNLMGPILEKAGAFGEIHELLSDISNSLPLANPDRRIPTRENFVGAMQAAQQAAMMAQAGPQEGTEVEVQHS